MGHFLFEIKSILDSDLILDEDKVEILLDLRQMMAIERRVLEKMEKAIGVAACGEQLDRPTRPRQEARKKGLHAPQRKPSI